MMRLVFILIVLLLISLPAY
ncbi:type I toxin-antitoxin system Ibs family toxin [Escherichia coli]